MGKVEKLNKDIDKLEAKIYLIHEEIDAAKKEFNDKLITRAEYTTLKMKNQTKVRGFRTAIGKKEKARMLLEKKYREKAEKKEKKRLDREEK
jgi:hypothetical protein